MKETGLVMGVDGGGSQTTAWLANLEGRILGIGRSTASNYQSVGGPEAQNALLAAIQQSFRDAGIPFKKVDSLCMGLAGFGRDFERRMIKEWAEKVSLACKVMVVNDADLILWAATPQGWGMGLVCGTGSIAVGRTQGGETARAGGWGYLIGDEGSGYAIGIAALRAAVQAADHRIPGTRLVHGVLSALGLEQVEELVPYLYQGNPTRETIARLSGVVFTMAQKGDQQARSILDIAAFELSKAALAVGSRLGWKSSVPCAIGGGIFCHHPDFVERVLDHIRGGGLTLDPVQLAENPVAGAVRLAIQSLGSDFEATRS